MCWKEAEGDVITNKSLCPRQAAPEEVNTAEMYVNWQSESQNWKWKKERRLNLWLLVVPAPSPTAVASLGSKALARANPWLFHELPQGQVQNMCPVEGGWTGDTPPTSILSPPLKQHQGFMPPLPTCSYSTGRGDGLLLLSMHWMVCVHWMGPIFLLLLRIQCASLASNIHTMHRAQPAFHCSIIVLDKQEHELIFVTTLGWWYLKWGEVK